MNSKGLSIIRGIKIDKQISSPKERQLPSSNRQSES